MRRAILAVSAALAVSGAAQAQTFSPRTSLRSIITAFQVCGPQQAYHALSPYLFAVVAQQTNGSGCYLAIAQAGPVTSLQVKDRKEFPIGPLYLVRVTHAGGTKADWFIGFNNSTGKIEYLSFQPAFEDEQTSIEEGPDGDAEQIVEETDKGDPDASDECKRFPRMCP